MSQSSNQQSGQIDQPYLSKVKYVRSSLGSEANKKQVSLKGQDFLVNRNLSAEKLLSNPSPYTHARFYIFISLK